MAVAGFREGTPAADILAYIQRHGSATVKELEDTLGVSTTAVREQLAHLSEGDLITSSKVQRGPGRPLYRYTLTAKAQNLFPKGYDVLINLLLEEILALDGHEKLQQILNRVSIRLAEQYTSMHESNTALRERLMALSFSMAEQGMPINVVELPEGGFNVNEYACPYFEVAQEHDSVCRMERRMLEEVLGQRVHLTQRMIEGHTGCQFVIEPDAAKHQG